MSLYWSDNQQRCLAALGYTLYRLGAPGSSMDTETTSPPPRGSNARAADAIAAQDTKALVGAQHAFTPLLRALLRAANVDPAVIVDAESWIREQQIPSLAQLRNDPGLKRVLWRRLRAMRRERASR